MSGIIAIRPVTPRTHLLHDLPGAAVPAAASWAVVHYDSSGRPELVTHDLDCPDVTAAADLAATRLDARNTGAAATCEDCGQPVHVGQVSCPDGCIGTRNARVLADVWTRTNRRPRAFVLRGGRRTGRAA